MFLGELFPGRDAKFRYLREIRTEMYQKMVGWLKEVDPNLFVYLCMESKEVWEKVFGWSPENSRHLNQMFEERVREVFGQMKERKPDSIEGLRLFKKWVLFCHDLHPK